MYWMMPNGSYYTGDRQAADDRAVPRRPGPHHEWNGTGWDVPLPVAKELKTAAIKAAFEAYVADGFEAHLGFRVDMAFMDALMWEKGVALSEANGKAKMTVRAFDNSTHPDVSLADCKRISQDQQQAFADAIQKKWSLQSQVQAATTLAEVEAVTW